MPEIGNAVLESFQVLVNGIDCSAAVNGELWANLNHPKFSEDGLFPCTGTLTLLPVEGFAPNFFSPRKNRAQWRRGVSVVISTQKPGGALEREFTGFILKRPATPEDLGDRLEISVGDELAFRANDEPAEDKAGVVLGALSDRTSIIERITAAWTGDWQGTIPEYPLNYPIPKYQGSFVSQLGDLAASAGYGLYCDREGSLKAAKFGDPIALFARTYANTFLSAADGSDEPAAKVKALISGRQVEENERLTTDITEDVGALLTPAGQNGDYIRRRTTVKREWSTDYKTLTETTTVELPDIDQATGSIQLIVSTVTIETKEFSRNADGKLLTRNRRVLSNPIFAGGASTSGELQQTARQLETWAYVGEVPQSVTLETFGFSISTINAGTELTTTEEVIQRAERTEWEELAGNYWRRTETVYIPLLRDGVRVSDIGSTESFYGTQYRPGEPERHIPTHSSTQIEYEGCALFGGVADEDGAPAIYRFEYGVSEAQADEIAALHGAVLIGRDAGWNCGMEMPEEWRQWSPASAVQLTLPDGDISLMLIDGVSRNFSRAAATVSFGCVELGTIGTADISPLPGRIIGDAAAIANPPTTTGLIPPYLVVTAGSHGFGLGFEGSEAIGASPSAESGEHGFGLGFEGQTPFGNQSEHGFELGFESSEAAIAQPLSIREGGTGATGALAARQALGISSAGGDLSGLYPNPLIADQAVTFAKMQQVSPGILLGNSQAVQGPIEEIGIGDNLVLENGVLSASGDGSGGSGGSGFTSARLISYDDCSEAALPTALSTSGGGSLAFDTDRLERFAAGAVNVIGPTFTGGNSVSGAARFRLTPSSSVFLFELRNITKGERVIRVVWDNGNQYYNLGAGPTQNVTAKGATDAHAIAEIVLISATKIMCRMRWDDGTADYQSVLTVPTSIYEVGDDLRYQLQIINAAYTNYAVYKGDYRLLLSSGGGDSSSSSTAYSEERTLNNTTVETWSGLSGLTRYELEVSALKDATQGGYRIFINGDTDTSHYVGRRISGRPDNSIDSTVLGSNVGFLRASSRSRLTAQIRLINGSVEIDSSELREEATGDFFGLVRLVYTEPVTEITSISIEMEGTGGALLSGQATLRSIA